jgi:hypothetical protein
MPSTIPANLYCTEDDIRSWLSDLGVDLRIDDDDSGTVEDDEEAFLTRCLAWGTNQVNKYCVPRYRVQDLAQSYAATLWATIFAAHFLCSRRCNPIPESIQAYAFGDSKQRGALGDLEDVKKGEMQIWDIGTRNVDWPAWSNVRVDARYRLRQARVQRPISEQTPTEYTQKVDWPSEYSYEI